MPLLGQMIRTAAITGRTDTIGAWCAGRQGGQWARQTVRAAMPTAEPQERSAPAAPSDPAKTLRDLTELHRRGFVTDGEFESLRARLGV